MAAITSCILTLLENPAILKKAQEELDRIVKLGHLPDFVDQDSLPYVTAITMEILRWRDVIPLGESRMRCKPALISELCDPLGIPHYLEVGDEYKGYRIPAGTIVIANSWYLILL